MAGNQGHNKVAGVGAFQPISLVADQRASAPPPADEAAVVDADGEPMSLAAQHAAMLVDARFAGLFAGEDRETAVSDHIANLLHWLRREAGEGAARDALDGALMHWEAELGAGDAMSNDPSIADDIARLHGRVDWSPATEMNFLTMEFSPSLAGDVEALGSVAVAWDAVADAVSLLHSAGLFAESATIERHTWTEDQDSYTVESAHTGSGGRVVHYIGESDRILSSDELDAMRDGVDEETAGRRVLQAVWDRNLAMMRLAARDGLALHASGNVR